MYLTHKVAYACVDKGFAVGYQEKETERQQGRVVEKIPGHDLKVKGAHPIRSFLGSTSGGFGIANEMREN